MAYQYEREPRSDDATNALANTCESFAEKLVVWTLLDTGLRVSEFAASTKRNVQWQERRLVIHGKGGPYGKRSKHRVIPVTDRVRRLIEYQFAEHNEIGMSGRTIQRIVKRVANRAGIARPVTPHVPRHTFAVNCIKIGRLDAGLADPAGPRPPDHDRALPEPLARRCHPRVPGEVVKARRR